MLQTQLDKWVTAISASMAALIFGVSISFWLEHGTSLWITRVITGLANCF